MQMSGNLEEIVPQLGRRGTPDPEDLEDGEGGEWAGPAGLRPLDAVWPWILFSLKDRSGNDTS